MTSTGIPWEHEPDYVAACRTELRPGEADTYIPARLPGVSPTDVTGFQIGLAYWNIDNLPRVCYVLNPPVEWDVFRKSPRPAQKLDESGRPMWERHPWPGTAARPLLDFPILRNIDTICTQVGWEWLEFIMRLDPRINWDDIDMRMEHAGARAAYDHTIDVASKEVTKQVTKAKSKFINALQTRCSRGRVAFKMISWRERLRPANKSRDDVLRQLSAHQIANNTTRGSTPGIINPLLPDTPVNRVYRQRRQSQPSTPSNAQLDAQSGPPAHMLAANHQASGSSMNAAALPQPYIHETAPPHSDQLRVPLTMPSTQSSQEREASATSPAPLVIDDTSRTDDEPLNLGENHAERNIIDLTQDDTTDSDASTPPADTQSNRSPTGVFDRTPTPSNSFSMDPVPISSTPTTPQPLSGPGASTEEGSAVYRYDELAPFTEVGQEYLQWDWKPAGP